MLPMLGLDSKGSLGKRCSLGHSRTGRGGEDGHGMPRPIMLIEWSLEDMNYTHRYP
jgi:hypothetical protein